MQLVDPDQALKDLGIKEHNLRFTSTLYVDEDGASEKLAEKIYMLVKEYVVISIYKLFMNNVK